MKKSIIITVILAVIAIVTNAQSFSNMSACFSTTYLKVRSLSYEWKIESLTISNDTVSFTVTGTPDSKHIAGNSHNLTFSGKCQRIERGENSIAWTDGTHNIIISKIDSEKTVILIQYDNHNGDTWAVTSII